jgi:hypothetical protein
LYQIITGKTLYQGSSARDVLVQAAQVLFTPILQLAPKAPKDLVKICEKALSASPGARHQTAGELAASLEAFLANAVVHTDEGVGRVVASGIIVATFLSLIAGVALLWSIIPTFREMGSGAIFLLLIGATGWILSFLEWRSQGRYRLDGLCLVFVAFLFMAGLLNFTTGLLTSIQSMEEAGLLEIPGKFEGVLVIGFWESLGSVPLAAILAVLQLFFWAVIRRRNQEINNPQGL